MTAVFVIKNILCRYKNVLQEFVNKEIKSLKHFSSCFSDVYRGCLSSQGRKVIAASLNAENGCFQIENYIGAGLSTYCICCGELCNTHDMTKHRGKDCKPPTYC